MMQKPQYAILRFAKYKGPEIGRIEAHNERTKEKYASNPNVDSSRSRLNFHLVQPERKYRAEAEKQIAEAGCRTRKDSVRVVETLVTASPEFFKGKKKAEIYAYFEEAVRFIEKYQSKSTIISAVVHMDEKTPHKGYTDFLSGMAEGTDAWAAMAVLALKKDNPTLKLHSILPCEGKADGWSASAQKLYYSILEQADEAVYVSKEYSKGCMVI